MLEDPSGRRRRRLRLVSRAIALALTAWLLTLVLGGVGLSPVPGVPFAHVLKPAAPPIETNAVKPAQPTAADLQPALPVDHRANGPLSRAAPVAGPKTTQRAATRRSASHRRQAAGDGSGRTRSPVAQGTHGPAPAATTHAATGRGRPSTTTTTTTTTTDTAAHGRSGSAPGRTRTTPPGRSTTTP